MSFRKDNGRERYPKVDSQLKLLHSNSPC